MTYFFSRPAPGRWIGPLLLLTTLLAWPAHSAQASEPCNPPNVIPREVCDMDTFRGSPPRQIPNGWTEFVLSGNPSFESHNDTFWGAPSLMVRSVGDTFKVGIFTQVGVTPGAGYRASIAWGAPNAPDTFGRQLGIDPTGGTDPNAPTVIWGPMHWGEGRILNYPPPDVNIDVKARALGETVTVFFLVDHPRSTGDNLIFIDAVALYPDESAPAVEIPPTETPAPEAPVEAIVQAAAAPEELAPEPTATPTETPTAVPTATPSPSPTATPSPTPTATPSPTATATWTPLPTVTPQQASLGMSQLGLDNLGGGNAGGEGNTPQVLLLLGSFSLGGAGVLGGSYWRLRRRR
ncbi:MAG: hypothetical protein H6642_04815 [Caldilineaceae bacterium]|nr:hypothetical protein [Caldilineaceae bacterium]